MRRARAIGVLADPATALALLEGTPAPTPRKQTALFVHLSAEAIAGLDPVGRCENTARAVLEQQIRSWCSRTDTHLTVTGIIDLADHTRSDAYEARGRLRERSDLIAGHCVFPFCARPARQCDHDHVVAHGAAAPPVTATSPPCAGATTASRPTPAGPTPSSKPASGSGPSPTDNNSSATTTAPSTSPPPTDPQRLPRRTRPTSSRQAGRGARGCESASRRRVVDREIRGRVPSVPR